MAPLAQPQPHAVATSHPEHAEANNTSDSSSNSSDSKDTQTHQLQTQNHPNKLPHRTTPSTLPLTELGKSGAAPASSSCVISSSFFSLQAVTRAVNPVDSRMFASARLASSKRTTSQCLRSMAIPSGVTPPCRHGNMNDRDTAPRHDFSQSTQKAQSTHPASQPARPTHRSGIARVGPALDQGIAHVLPTLGSCEAQRRPSATIHVVHVRSAADKGLHKTNLGIVHCQAQGCEPRRLWSHIHTMHATCQTPHDEGHRRGAQSTPSTLSNPWQTLPTCRLCVHCKTNHSNAKYRVRRLRRSPSSQQCLHITGVAVSTFTRCVQHRRAVLRHTKHNDHDHDHGLSNCTMLPPTLSRLSHAAQLLYLRNMVQETLRSNQCPHCRLRLGEEQRSFATLFAGNKGQEMSSTTVSWPQL